MDHIVLTELQTAFPHLATQFEELNILHEQRLWHEITLILFKLISDEKVLASPKALLKVYEGFVTKFTKKLDQLALAKFLTSVSSSFEDQQGRDSFLQSKLELFNEKSAINIIKLQQISCRLSEDRSEENEISLITLKEEIEKSGLNERVVFSYLYRVSYEFHAAKGNLEELYLNALQFLAYTQPSEIPAEYQHQISRQMAVAILSSPKIYNFSELLQQPVVQSLENSADSWLHSLIVTFNRGDVAQYNRDIQNYLTLISADPILSKNSKLLEEKIRIMAFLDLVFNLQKNERTISFQNIANRTKQQIHQVEYLLMRSMALGLIKGVIDQVLGVVTVNWILPRVLDQPRILVIKQKFDVWTQGLDKLIKTVEQEPLPIY